MENWFVFHSKPKKEAQVERLFQEGGVRAYVPKVFGSGKPRPLFPGYGFVYFDFPVQFRLIQYTRGVKALVGNRQGPIPVPQLLVDQIQSRESNGFVELLDLERPQPGDEIEVREGPLKGIRGIFHKELKDSERVAILLTYVSYQGQLLIEKSRLKKIR